jgi:hypothetical protein
LWRVALAYFPQKKYYPDLPSFTTLIRHTMMELIASHFTEEELKKRGLFSTLPVGHKARASKFSALRQVERNLKSMFLQPEKSK